MTTMAEKITNGLGLTKETPAPATPGLGGPFAPPPAKPLDKDAFQGNKGQRPNFVQQEREKKAAAEKAAADKKVADLEAAVAKGKALNKELDDQIEDLKTEYNKLLRVSLMAYGAIVGVNKESEYDSLLSKMDAELAVKS